MTKSKKNTKKKIKLSVEERKIYGKKVKKLRRKGVLPANIYGEGFKSTAVSVLMKDFVNAYKTAGETQVVYIRLKDQELPAIIHNLQKHPVSDMPLHTDFRKVSLKKKIETEVPVKFVGESEGVVQKKGDLLTLKDELVVKALPDSIPQYIEIDISSLRQVDDEIVVKDLKTSDKFEILDEPDTIIVKIASHKEEVIEEAKPEEEEIEGEPTEGERKDKQQEEVGEKQQEDEKKKGAASKQKDRVEKKSEQENK